MKKYLLALVLLVASTLALEAQSISTNRQIYNFQTGDIFHFEISYPYYHSFSNSVINQKYFSANQDTVFYVFTYIQESTSSFAQDTIISGTDTVFYTHLDSLLYNGMIDTVYNNTSLYHNRKINEYVFDDTINLHYYHRVYADSLGEVLTYYLDLNSMDIAKTKLIYYKKGNEVWGNPHFVGIAEIPQNKTEIHLFPNPASTFLKIRTSKAIQAKITLYNLAGQKVMEQKESLILNEKSIPVQHLSSGIYYIYIATEDDQKVLKFIKE